jgi:divalent metal cation (Fe/Co/Zn/Cd) transporter
LELLAAMGVFIAGAAFSLREGIHDLAHPSATSSFAVAYVVLGVSTVFDLLSLRQSAHQMNVLARRAKLSILEEAAATSDPSLRTVFNSDAVSIGGDLIAFAGLGLSQILGSSVPQAVAAVLIGLVMIRISLRLIRRNHNFLLGQPILAPDRDRVRSFLLAYPGVTAIHELLVTFVGPGQVWVLARIDVTGELRAEQVTSLVRGIEADLERESRYIYRVDVVPVGVG